MMSKSVTAQNLSAEESELLRKFKGKLEFNRYGSDGLIVTSHYHAIADRVRNMSLRNDDVFVQMYPRSGVSATQEIVWLLKNNLNYESASKSSLDSRYHYLELAALLPEKWNGITPDDVASPRLFKTHLSLGLLPSNILDTCRVVHVARDPREVAVSFYIHNRSFKPFSYSGDFKSYWQLFIKDLILFTPYFSNIKQAWENRQHPNMLFLYYDDFVNDLPSVVERIAKFLGKEYPEANLKNLADHVSQHLEPYFSFCSKSNEYSVCKGKEGDWRHHFDEEMRQEAQEWMQRHLADTDLKFNIL